MFGCGCTKCRICRHRCNTINHPHFAVFIVAVFLPFIDSRRFFVLLVQLKWEFNRNFICVEYLTFHAFQFCAHIFGVLNDVLHAVLVYTVSVYIWAFQCVAGHINDWCNDTLLSHIMFYIFYTCTFETATQDTSSMVLVIHFDLHSTCIPQTVLKCKHINVCWGNHVEWWRW